MWDCHHSPLFGVSGVLASLWCLFGAFWPYCWGVEMSGLLGTSFRALFAEGQFTIKSTHMKIYLHILQKVMVMLRQIDGLDSRS